MPDVIGEALVRVRALVNGTEQDITRPLEGAARSAAASMTAAFASARVAEFINESIGAASDLNEAMNRTSVVFGESADQVHAWAEGSAKDFGLARAEAESSVSTFGNMFQQMGIGATQAASMSERMVELAADLASFHNADITDVIQAQTAAFRGEYDSVQRFVPTINAAAVEQYALSHGLAASTDEITNQDRALAVNALLMEGAGQAAGDFDRTSDGLANRQRILTAEMANLRTEVGAALIPVMETLVGVATTLVSGFSALPGPVQTGVVVLGGMSAAAVAVTKAIDTAKSVMEAFAPVINLVRAATEAKTVADTASVAATAAAGAAQTSVSVGAGASATAMLAAAGSASSLAAAETAGTAAASALAVAETEVATAGVAAGAGLTAALGPLALLVGGAAVAVGALAFFTRGQSDAEAAIKRVDEALVNQNGILDLSADSWTKYALASSRFEARHQLDDLNELGITLPRVNELLQQGAQGFDSFLASLEQAGKVRDVTAELEGLDASYRSQIINANGYVEVAGRVLAGNGDLVRSFQLEQQALLDNAEASVRNAQASGQVTEAQVAAAEAAAEAAGQGGNWIDIQKRLNLSLDGTASASNAAASAASAYGSSAAGAASGVLTLAAANDQYNASVKAASTALGSVRSTVFGAADAHDAFTKAVDGSTGAQQRGAGASRGSASSARDAEKRARDLADAEDDLAEAIQRRYEVMQGADPDELRSAELDEIDRARDLADAKDEVTDAEERLQRAREASTAEAQAQREADAERDLAAAQRDVERAQLAVEDAQTKLNEARASGDPRAIREAELDLADAQDRVQDASRRAEGAQKDLTTAKDDGKAAADNVKQAEEDLQVANENVERAAIAHRDAQEQLTAKKNEGKEGSKELKDAEDAVEQAQRRVNDALAAGKGEYDGATGAAGGYSGAMETADEKLRNAVEAGGNWIKFLIDSKAPAHEVRDAMDEIRDKLDKIAGASPEMQAAVDAAMDVIEGSVRDAEKAADDLLQKLLEIARTDPTTGVFEPDAPIGPSNHSGGVVGVDAPDRWDRPSALGDEYMRILKRGETVLTTGQMAWLSDALASASSASGGGVVNLSVNVTATPGVTDAQAKRQGELVGASAATVLMSRRLAVEVRR